MSVLNRFYQNFFPLYNLYTLRLNENVRENVKFVLVRIHMRLKKGYIRKLKKSTRLKYSIYTNLLIINIKSTIHFEQKCRHGRTKTCSFSFDTRIEVISKSYRFFYSYYTYMRTSIPIFYSLVLRSKQNKSFTRHLITKA